jgi:hypothetical protein
LKRLQFIAQSRGIASEELDHYFTPKSSLESMQKIFPGANLKDMKDIQFLMCRLFYSLQNTGYKNFVKLKKQAETHVDLLCEFVPKAIIAKYPKKAAFIKEALSRTDALEINKDNKKNWQDFFDGVYDSAKLLAPYNDASEFIKAVDQEANHPAKGVLADTITDFLQKPQRKPKGLGPAVAADFVKESDLADGGKPDVHILEVLFGIGALETNSDLNGALEIMRQIAKVNNTTVFEIDKMIWLICTKNFYLHDAGDDRVSYIQMLNKELNEG